MTRRVLPAILIALSLAALLASGASAGIYTFDVPNVNGTNSLDLGMSFSSISNIKMGFSGSASFGMYLDWDGELQDLYPKVVVSIWDTAGPAYQGSGVFPWEGSFSNLQLDLVDLGAPCFMDGQANLSLGYGEVALYPVYQVASHSSIHCSSAQLIIDGVAAPVPEPASLIALLSGLGGLLVRRRMR